MRRKTRTGPLVPTGLWETVLGFLKTAGALEDRARRSLERHKKALQTWVVKTAVTGLSIFMCIAFLVLGILFTAIDRFGFSRGAVFTCGGLLGLLVLWLAGSIGKKSNKGSGQ